MWSLAVVVAVSVGSIPSSPWSPSQIPSPARLLAASAPRAEPTPLGADAQALLDLEQRISGVQTKINAVDVNYPTGYLLLSYGGYVLASTGLLGLPLLGYGLLAYPAVLPVGVALLALGGVGIAMIVVGLSAGGAIARDARLRRDALIDERTRLEAELRARQKLERGERAHMEFVPIAALRF